ncbi:MAG: ABC transporter permease [Chitinophagaceae bacterium]|nr:ABC transporter permease [Chitinophagaceae bacterium]
MKIIATIRKESLLLIRDPGGMALIFLMPLGLVIVMALIQDAPFRDYQETKLEVVFVDNDKDSLGKKIQNVFLQSPNIEFVQESDSNKARSVVRSGKYKAAIIIPAGASESLRKKNKQLIARIFANLGYPGASNDSTELPTANILVLFDPAIKINYKQALASAVEKVIANVESEWIVDQLQNQLRGNNSSKEKMKVDFSGVINVQQQYASKHTNENMVLNSVQHNVPAWTMFAMFFILFPLAGNFIKEREEGSMLRLRLISGSQFPVMAGKFLFYFGICLLQFMLMILVGIFIMPLLNLPQLGLGNNIIGILLTACSVAMAATGYGLLIAVFFRTPQQALSFGSISVVILAALGGVWVPVYVMPEMLQGISRFSPLNWGLESFNNLFLRDASTLTILPDVLKLIVFAMITLSISIFIHKSRTIS